MRPRSLIVMLAALSCTAAAAAQRGAFTETVTDRGTRIWSFPDDGNDRFVLAVLVGTGARDEAPAQAGIGHLLQHVVLARTATRPAADADPDLPALGITRGETTSHESTVFYLKCEAEDWHFAVEWLADHVLHPAFESADLDAARRIVRTEIEKKHPHAGEITYESRLYPGHALGRATGGDAALVGTLDRAALQHFHAVHYRAANVAIGFAGRVPRDEVADAIRAAFAGLPSGRGLESHDPVQPRSGTFPPVGESDTALLITGFHLPASTPRELVMAHLLGGYLNARLYDEMRAQPWLAYPPSVDVFAHRDTCRLDVHVDLRQAEAVDEALATVDTLVQELQRVDVARLATARESLAGLLEASSGPQLAESMRLAWLVRRVGMSPGELALAMAAIGERDIAEFARNHCVAARRFTIADTTAARSFSPWAAFGVLAVLLLLVDGFQSFAGAKRLLRLVASPLLRLRPRRRNVPATSPVIDQPPADADTTPIVPVPGDEIERSIQRYFEEEERGR